MRGNIRQRTPETWSLTYHTRDYTGKSQRVYKTVRGSRADAEAALARFIEEAVDEGIHDREKVKLEAYLEEWLQIVARVLADRTLRDYEWTIRKYILPELGHIRMASLQPFQIDKFYGGLMAKGAGVQTILHIHRILRKSLRDAQKKRLVDHVATDGVTLPRLKRKEQKALSPHEAARCMSVFQGTLFHIPILLALLCGMRRGEICALRWQDVDLDEGEIHVRHSLDVAPGGKISYKDPKSEKSRRVIPLTSSTVRALREHKIYLQRRQLALGEYFDRCGHVAAWQDGSPMLPAALTHAVPRIIKRWNAEDGRREADKLPVIGFHALRHTFASLLPLAGTDIKTVQTLLGHAQLSTTADIYSHVFKEAKVAAVSHLDSLIFGEG